MFTSLCTSGSVSENGNVSSFEMRGDSFTQQRPVSRQRSMNLNPAAIDALGRIDAAHMLDHEVSG